MAGLYTYVTKDIYKYLALLFLKWPLAPNAAIAISTCFYFKLHCKFFKILLVTSVNSLIFATFSEFNIENTQNT